MKQPIALAAALLVLASTSLAAIKTQVIEYKQDTTTLKGFLAYDDSTTAKRPGILVVPEWWGNNDYAHHRAEMLAQLGYVGFAIDMYGDGKTTTQAAQATEWSTQVKTNPKMESARALAALETLKAQSMVDTSKIAAIGYCFGGGVVLNMARNNMSVLGVVSFHGDLSPAANPPASVGPKILACHGANDTFVPQQVVNAFIEEMRKAHADWELDEYSGAVHAFTNPDAGKFGLNGIAYNKQADERSWQRMQDFLKEIFKL